MQQMNRIEPAMPAGAYKTYQIIAPLSTHWRNATCEEAGCERFVQGWMTVVDESTELGRQQAHYIRHDQTRHAVEEKDEAGLTVFTFTNGQHCFGSHRVRVEREEIFVERGGDWRGNPSGDRRQHVRPADWLDSFTGHQDRLATRLSQG